MVHDLHHQDTLPFPLPSQVSFKRPRRTFSYYLFKIYRSIFGRKCFYGWNLLLYALSLRGLGIQNSKDLRDSGEMTFLSRYLNGRSQFVAIDAGAHKGHYSYCIKKYSPDARVWALEPDPAIFNLLKEAADRYHYYPINKGLSDQEGSFTFYDAEGFDRGSAYASVYKEVFAQIYKLPVKSKTVQMTTVDNLMTELGLSKIDLLKLDIEGHEYCALKGAKKAIEENRIDCIQFEFDEVNALLKIFLRDFALLLPQYDFYRILPSGELLSLDLSLIKSTEIFAFQNIIALRQKAKN